MIKLTNYSTIILILLQFQAYAQFERKTKEEKKMKIIYIMDPQCGWCYGNSQNVTALQDQFKNEFDFELQVGGMWLGQAAPVGGDQLSQFLQDHAPRMAATTGARVDTRYYELAKDSTYTFSSLEPSAAIELIKEIAPNKVFSFAKKVQEALFVGGKRLDEKETYHQILKSLSIDIKPFDHQWMGAENIKNTTAAFASAGQLTKSYPSLVLTRDGNTEIIGAGYFNKEAMIQKLTALK